MARRTETPALQPGTKVEVRSRFDHRWARGFEIAEIHDGPNYTLRRRSDGAILPTEFAPHEVREERRNNEMWWY